MSVLIGHMPFWTSVGWHCEKLWSGKGSNTPSALPMSVTAGIFATVRYDGMYYELLVGKEDADAARNVLKALS
jgi:hypothetical protein